MASTHATKRTVDFVLSSSTTVFSEGLSSCCTIQCDTLEIECLDDDDDEDDAGSDDPAVPCIEVIRMLRLELCVKTSSLEDETSVI